MRRRLGAGEVVLEPRTHPSEELRRHVSEIANYPSGKDLILLGRRELLELRGAPNQLFHACKRNPVDGPAVGPRPVAG